MSDFDNLFREKLDEEQAFPRRNKNWKMVSKRLDAFDAGGITHHSYLKYWKIAAVAAAITASVLAWKVVHLKQENQRLKEIVQTSSLPATPQSHEIKTGISQPHSNTSALPTKSAQTSEITPTTTTASSASEAHKKENDNPTETSQIKKTTPQPEQPGKGSRIVQKQPTHKPTLRNTPSASRQNPISEIVQQSNTPPSGKQTLPSQEKPEQPTNDPSSITPNNNEQTLSAHTPEPAAPDVAISAPLVPVDTASGAKQPASDIAKVDTVSTVVKDSVSVPKALPQPPVALQPDTVKAEKTMALEPPKAPRAYSRLRAGAQIFRGFAMPGEDGVSILQGQGISAAWRFWNQFSLTTDANWLRFDINTTKFVPRFHPHHPGPGPHGGPGQDDQLVKVESTQRQRQLSLGLQYTVPVHFPVRPNLHISHTWVHIDPQLITYTYEEQPHGPMHNPEIRYQAEKSAAQDLNKIWRAGIGLQYDTHRWIFGIGADYMRDFASSDAMFNSVFVQAGLQYKIL